MRLTLRALLAYLYNVLEPADASEFSAKVQESAVASGLVQRIGAITKKMRMNAPRVDAKGTADDANNVAEYLDNSLPEDQVADFERACINSDMHLAEVASSYQILTMVLGKAADIPDSLQTRVYRLPLDLATTHKESAADGEHHKRLKKTIEKVAASARENEAGMKAVHTGSTHNIPQVPEYLRGEHRAGSLIKWLAIAAAVVLMGFVAIRAAGPFDSSNGLIGWMFAPGDEIADASDQPTVAPIAPSEPSDDKSTKVPTSQGDKEPAPEVDSQHEDKSSEDEAQREREKERAATDTKVAVVEPSPGPPLPPEPPVEPEPATSAKGSDAKRSAPPAEKSADPPDARPEGPMEVGRYVSDDQLLTRFDVTSNMWFLARPRAILTAGERLVVLPTYRPQMALASGVQITFAGESEVRMEEPLRRGAARMTVEYGRFLVVTLGNAGAQVEFDFLGVEGLLTLEDSDTVVAIDARHYLPPGASTDNDERIRVIEMFATNGRARWEETGADAVEIQAAQVLTYIAGEEQKLEGPVQPPMWMDAESLPQIDRFTSNSLQRLLTPEKPVHVQLRELMADRRAEVRALASRCLAQIGEFEPLVRELGNVQQKAFWAAEVETLRQSFTRSPEANTLILQSFESFYPKDAELLFRLLIGFSPEQLESEGAKTLVESLESPETAVRVMAIDTLRRITNAQLLYRPEKPPSENRVPINKWTQRMEDGSIVYATEPSPLEVRSPLGEAAPAGEGKAPPARSRTEEPSGDGSKEKSEVE